MKSAEEGQVIAQPVPKALSVISVNFCELKTNLNDYISREHTFFSGSSLHKGGVLGTGKETQHKVAH